ncbi:MAG: PKD domain-containing protein [Candidatus Nanohalobium sp.]
MRKIMALLAASVLLTGFSAAASVDLEMVQNPSMTAGRTGEAVISFRYEGDQFEDRAFDPFALLVSVDHEKGNLSNRYFDASGRLSYSWAGNSYSFDLECVAGPEEVSSMNQTGSFYSTQSQVVESNELLCVPKNTLSVLKSNTFIEDGKIELNFSTSPRVAPGKMNITYSFGSFSGFPQFDPLLEANENGTVELEDHGIRIENLEQGTEIGVVGYSALNVQNPVPDSESFSLGYYELEPRKKASGKVLIEYDQQSIDGSNRLNPRLYRCSIQAGNCDWELISNQSAANGILKAQLDHFSLFGLFTSKERKVVIREETQTVDGDGGGGTTVVTRTETEYVNNTQTETEKVIKPTASFDILYTSPGVRKDVRFNASDSYDPDGSIESYKWSFGESGKTVEQSFPVNKSVNVTLTVTDSQGVQDSVTKQLNSGIRQGQETGTTDDRGTQDASQSITGQFLGSTSDMVGILALLVVAALLILVYTGRVNPEALYRRAKQKIE